MATGININGDWNVGRYNRIVRKGKLVSLEFCKKNSANDDKQTGSISLATDNGTLDILAT